MTLDRLTKIQVNLPRIYPSLFVYVRSHCICVRLFVNMWTIAHQAPLSLGFFRPEYWSRLPFPSPGDLPDPEIKPTSLLHWQASPLPPGTTWVHCTYSQSKREFYSESILPKTYWSPLLLPLPPDKNDR